MTLQQLQQFIVIAGCGSLNEAAKRLFVSQPNLSAMVRELEKECGELLFIRTNRGIVLTPEGEEFYGYAKQVTDQYTLLENRYISRQTKRHFSVSSQHYSFAVQAFIEMVKKVGMNTYEFAMHETRTREVIEHVRNRKSEIGILYLCDFNEQIMRKVLKENGLTFEELAVCDTYVYLWKQHPLAGKTRLSMAELAEYPCLAFEQGSNSSFYYAEEMKSTYEYDKIIRGDDRATLLNLMVGLNGYTLCSGIISEELNGSDYAAIPLEESEKMRIGYIRLSGTTLTKVGQLYIEELKKILQTGENKEKDSL